jgi:hypothetical protein
MGAYCKPIRPAEWFEQESETYGRESQEQIYDVGWLEAFGARTIAAQGSLEDRFRKQAEKWQRETQHLSSPLQKMMHPSYQAILGMGADHRREIVSLMLRDLQQNRGDWFLALSYLTYANPTNPRDAGKTDRLASEWIKWGKDQGLL